MFLARRFLMTKDVIIFENLSKKTKTALFRDESIVAIEIRIAPRNRKFSCQKSVRNFLLILLAWCAQQNWVEEKYDLSSPTYCVALDRTLSQLMKLQHLKRERLLAEPFRVTHFFKKVWRTDGHEESVRAVLCPTTEQIQSIEQEASKTSDD